MTIGMRTGLHYATAALVGLCFGLLIAGAVAFVQAADTAVALEWQNILHTPGR